MTFALYPAAGIPLALALRATELPLPICIALAVGTVTAAGLLTHVQHAREQRGGAK